MSHSTSPESDSPKGLPGNSTVEDVVLSTFDPQLHRITLGTTAHTFPVVQEVGLSCGLTDGWTNGQGRWLLGHP
jgi:hypothetical protein